MNQPFTDKKLKEFDDTFRYFAGKPLPDSFELTHNHARAFLTQAITEAQQETAREIYNIIEREYQLSSIRGYVSKHAISLAISSKFLKEDSTKHKEV